MLSETKPLSIFNLSISIFTIPESAEEFVISISINIRLNRYLSLDRQDDTAGVPKVFSNYLLPAGYENV